MAIEVLVAVTAKIGEYLIEPIGRPFGYLIYYNKNINVLKNRIPTLDSVHVGVQGSVSAADRAGELILPNVHDWLAKVDLITQDSAKILNNQAKANPRCLGQFCCPGLKSRYQLSKSAKKKTSIIDKLLRDGQFGRVSYPAHLPTMWSKSLQDIEVFESRRSTFEGIIEALKDDDIIIIGVYGMGGIGKTTIVKEAANQAMESKLFDEIVFTVVSHLPNLGKIQGDIADMLGINLREENELVRAGKLRQRLNQAKRTLVILDDLWAIVDLEAVGIPRCCKVLLTTRNRDVCNEMNSHIKFPITVLSDTDSWNLFKKMSSDQVDSRDLNPIATGVAKECGGLPIAIVTVARSLRDKSKHVWTDALRQLKNSYAINIKGMHAKVYKSLELSFNFLENEELKFCFLLCSLFEEDTDIPVECLARYGLGLGFFHNVYKLDEARDRAHTLVDNLKAACLLLDGDSEDSVNMHDVVRDFAISVASKSGYVFLSSDDSGFISLPNVSMLSCSHIMSLIVTNIAEFPVGLNFPKLQFCLLECSSGSAKVQDDFFELMKELKVVQMRRVSVPSIPQSLLCLKNFRALFLDHCKLGDVSLIGELKGLEILSLIGSEIQQLPERIKQLVHLRILDLTDCENLTQIPYNVISRLSRLECLCMRNSFSNWGSEGQATIRELNFLPFLSTLELHIPDVQLLPYDLTFEKLIEFRISIGSYFSKWIGYSYPQTLRLRVDQDITLQVGLSTLLRRAQHLILDYPSVDYMNFKKVVYNLKREGIANLKCLEVYGYNQIEYLFDTRIFSVIDISVLHKLKVASMDNLKEICYGLLPVKSFSNLCELQLSNLPELMYLWKDPSGHVLLANLLNVRVFHCHKLENLFLQHEAKGLRRLKTLHVWSCEMLKEIISSETQGVTTQLDEVVLASLNSLRLEVLPSLTSFCPEIPSLDSQYLFNKKVIFQTLEELSLRELKSVKDIWHPQLPANSFCRLRLLTVFACDSIKSIFSSNIPQTLHKLETLSVEWCDLLEQVCELDNIEHNSTNIILPQIRVLLLGRLPRLKHLWWNEITHGFLSLQSLNSLVIYGCDDLSYIFSLSSSRGLVQFQQLEIHSCSTIKEIFVTGRAEEGNDTVVLPQLSCIELKDLPELTSFFRGDHTFQCASLKIIRIEDCPNMKTFVEANHSPIKLPLFHETADFPEVEEVHINGMNEIIEIWRDQMQENSFCKLRVLDINKCDNLLNIGLARMLQNLARLELLYITECGSLEDIFSPDSFDQAGDTSSLCSLIELRIQNLPKLRNIWWFRNSQKPCEFHNLRLLEVCGCNALNEIFSTSIATCLVQLQKLKIDSCESVKEIVGNDKEGTQEVATRVLPQIQTLELENLPNVISFCTTNGVLKWPSLKEVRLVNCPKMTSFISVTSEPSVVMNNGGLEGSLEHNYSFHIQSFFSKKVVFPALEKLRIESLQSLGELWDKELLEESFCRLKVVEIRKCDKLTQVLPSNLISRMDNLEELSVKHCESLEKIIEGRENKTVFPKVHTLRLVSLPNLQSFYGGGNKDDVFESPSLKKVSLEECPNMQIFTSPKLNEVQVGFDRLSWEGDLNKEEHGGDESTQETQSEEDRLDQLVH